MTESGSTYRLQLSVEPKAEQVSSMSDVEVVFDIVELEGIGPVKCWAAIYHASNGKCCMGEVQMESLPPLYSKQDENGIRTQLRKVMDSDDVAKLRAALAKSPNRQLHPDYVQPFRCDCED